MTAKKHKFSGQDKIFLKDLCFMGKHGCYETEKEQAQQFCINVEMQVDIAAAAATDDLCLTVDYSQIYAQIKNLVENTSFNLIETLAERVADITLAEPLVKRVWVEVEKCAAAGVGGSFRAAVAIERFATEEGAEGGENLP